MKSACLVEKLDTHILAVQEHGVGHVWHDAAIRTMASKGYQGFMTCAGPETSRPSGGVALFARKPMFVQHCVPRTGGMERAEALGRATIG
eukprot:3144921-Alexandrium_andersonii.AAC.1